jgi:chromosome segregation ATPase
MDLVEGKKKGNKWRLESEAFKQPIEIKIWFENQELAEFNARCDWLEKGIKENEKEIWILKDEFKEQQEWLIHFWELLEAFHNNLDKAWNKIDEQASEIKSLYKVIADQKTRIETLSGTMLKLQETINEIQKKVTKQPTIIHDKTFISWRESCGLWVFDIQAWDYLMLLKTVVGEHNEYVTNEDGLVIEKINVSWPYIPFYKLEWGTELDTPTATIYYDLVLMPI